MKEKIYREWLNLFKTYLIYVWFHDHRVGTLDSISIEE